MEAKKSDAKQSSSMLLGSQLDLFIAGVNFPSSSCVNLYQRTTITRNNWVMFASTETISGSRDPKYTRKMFVQYSFSIKQEILAEIIDADTKSLAGSVEFNITTLLTAPNQTLKLCVRKTYPAYSNDDSFLRLRIDNFTDSLDEIRLQFAASFLKSYLLTPKTYFSVWQMDPKEKKFMPVLKGEVYVGDVPVWEMIRPKAIDLCGKDFSRLLRVVVHKIPKIHQEKIMGHVDFTLNDIFYGKLSSKDIIKFSQKPGEPLQKTKIGTLFLRYKHASRVPQFLDYVFGGLDLYSVIAIDFSNRGNSYVKPESTHYNFDGKGSLYEKITKLLAEVLMPYNTNKKVVCNGFGANKFDLMNDCVIEKDTVCFPLSDNPDNSSYSDINTLSRDYQKIITSLEPCQVKAYTPVVKEIIESLRKDGHFASTSRFYSIILLVEEDIQDLREMIDFLGSIRTQISVALLFVGVGGGGSYKNLKAFGMYSGKLSRPTTSRGEILDLHSIVFLSLEEVKGSPLEVTKELLKVLPGIINSSMVKRNICADQGILKIKSKSKKSGSNSPKKLVAVQQNHHQHQNLQQARPHSQSGQIMSSGFI